MSLGAVVP